MQKAPTNLVMWPSGAPIPEGCWKYVGTKGDALDLLNKINALYGTNVTHLEGTTVTPGAALALDNDSFPFSVMSLDQGVTEFWAIKGTVLDPNTGRNYELYEYTGWLAARAQHPQPFVDRNPGPNLRSDIVAEPLDQYPGNVQLSWSK